MKKNMILSMFIMLLGLISYGQSELSVHSDTDIKTFDKKPDEEALTVTPGPADDKLVILWSSGDRDVALKMVFMYTYNAKVNQWWDDITLVVWGPSANILAEDPALQEYLGRIIEAGVAVKACKGCSDKYGVSEKLQELGISVSYIGEEFTGYIKEGRHMLTL